MTKEEKENIKNVIASCGITLTQASILCASTYKKYDVYDYSYFSETPTIFKKDHTELYVFPLKNGKYVLAFQGSNETLDWIDDINCLFTNKKTNPFYDDNIKVSSGFSNNYSAIAMTVMNLVYQYGVNKIILTGHSLGAANARRARFEIKSVFGVEVPVICFGEPHGGNKSYYAHCGITNTWSIQNGRDIVCKVPFASWGYYSPERIKVDGSNIPVPKWKWGWLFKIIGNADDHYPQRYVEGCRKF